MWSKFYGEKNALFLMVFQEMKDIGIKIFKESSLKLLGWLLIGIVGLDLCAGFWGIFGLSLR